MDDLTVQSWALELKTAASKFGLFPFLQRKEVPRRNCCVLLPLMIVILTRSRRLRGDQQPNMRMKLQALDLRTMSHLQVAAKTMVCECLS